MNPAIGIAFPLCEMLVFCKLTLSISWGFVESFLFSILPLGRGMCLKSNMSFPGIECNIAIWAHRWISHWKSNTQSLNPRHPHYFRMYILFTGINFVAFIEFLAFKM